MYCSLQESSKDRLLLRLTKNTVIIKAYLSLASYKCSSYCSCGCYRKITTKLICHAKSGPGKKWTPGPILAEKNGPGVHFFLPKVDLPCQKWTWSNFVKKKVDPVQFHCQNLSRSTFGRGKKWTRSSFAAEIQAGPLLAGGKSGPDPVSLPKSRQVHFWQGKKVDPVQFRCRNPGRSTFGSGKKWTRSSFAAEIQAGPLLAVEKSGPGPVSLPKSRQVHFWQGKKVDPVQFPC